MGIAIAKIAAISVRKAKPFPGMPFGPFQLAWQLLERSD